MIFNFLYRTLNKGFTIRFLTLSTKQHDMEAKEIVQKLLASPYKFTLASKIRDDIKKMDDDDSDYLVMELRRELANPHNESIVKPLREIIR